MTDRRGAAGTGAKSNICSALKGLPTFLSLPSIHVDTPIFAAPPSCFSVMRFSSLATSLLLAAPLAWASNVLEVNSKTFDSTIGTTPTLVELSVPFPSSLSLHLATANSNTSSYATWW